MHRIWAVSLAALSFLIALALAAIVVVYLANRGPDLPEPGPDWDFFGVVDRIESTEPIRKTETFTLGGHPEFAVKMGPMTMYMRNGLVLEVPGGTPGGTWCGMLSGFDGKRECVVGGGLDDQGRVEWFELLEPKWKRDPSGRRRVASTIGVSTDDCDSVVVRGIVMPKHENYEVFCDHAASVADVIATGLPPTATIDIETASVLVVSCIGVD